MTRQVALSEEAYARLRREKRQHESFSQAVIRLLETARRAKKDPKAFLDHDFKPLLSMEEHLRMVEEDRDRDRYDPWDDFLDEPSDQPSDEHGPSDEDGPSDEHGPSDEPLDEA